MATRQEDLEALDLERVRMRAAQPKHLAWPVGITVGLLMSMVLSALLFLPMFGRNGYQVGRYDYAHPVSRVTYADQTWVPQGQPVVLPDNRMVAIRFANEGFLLYSRRELAAGIGGGGGKPETGANPAQYPAVYLRTKDGRYQPLRLVSNPTGGTSVK